MRRRTNQRFGNAASRAHSACAGSTGEITGGSDVAEPYDVSAAGGVEPTAGMVVAIDDLPPLLWHAELGMSLPDVWTGEHQRGAQQVEGVVLHQPAVQQRLGGRARWVGCRGLEVSDWVVVVHAGGRSATAVPRVRAG